MCGIVASLCPKGDSSLEQVRSGLAAIRHRGPDGSQTWLSPGGHACLGHARLSIIDLETGNQPISNETGDVQVVVNGEFYGFEQIRACLETRGHRFRTRSDSEILVHLYEESGPECVRCLRGEFAFVLWDERTHTLLAARDAFGIKPLFYTESGGRLLFASEVKALRAAGVALSWDEQGFLEKLALDSPLQGRTLFDQVSTLPPAHYLIARNLIEGCGSVVLRSYWDFDYPLESEVPRHCSDDEHAQRLESVLDEAVHARLRADVPVACYLSGGIDSSSVLGLMSRHLSGPVHAFSLAFENAELDESPLAQATAQFLNARLTLVPVTQRNIAESVAKTVWHGETLFVNSQAVPKFLLSDAASKAGYKVVLTGEGADEVFGGYPAFVLDSLRYREESAALLPAFANGLEARPAEDSASWRCFQSRLGYVPAWYESREKFVNAIRQVLPPQFDLERLYHRFLDGFDMPGQMEGRSIVDRSMYLFNRTVLPGHILTVMGDRMEMAHAVEARLPFLDRNVVELSRSLPSSQKIRGGTEKYVLRMAMRGVVPPPVCGRRKRPLQGPAFQAQLGPMFDLMQDTLRGSGLDAVPFLDKKAAIALLDRATECEKNRRPNLDAALTVLLSSCLLGRQFGL